ncbi:hypothetical protein [Rhizobium sp.]|uniref:hypothetical protein n=1 Tax=Rhizobium sp. TaxID=391 RepID=UPI00289D6BB8
MTSALVLKPLWNNGNCTYLPSFVEMSAKDRVEVEGFAAEAGFNCKDGIWKPFGSRRDFEMLRSKLSAAGHELKFDHDVDGPFDLQRLHLSTVTRSRLEALDRFELRDLSGWCPVQAEGFVDGHYFYFRARGSYWKVEVGGNEKGTRSPRWWHEEPWPSATGFEAGYMSDDDAISCLLKAVDLFRYGDNSRFLPTNPRYARTILDGWSAGAISLQIACIRLGLTGQEAIRQMEMKAIEVPYTAQRELALVERRPIRRLSRRSE